jgi:uncharacterized protein YgbK (DUF1537 family)
VTPARWLILADDLTGAADCGVAFALRGFRTSVSWTAAGKGDPVLAVDANSRGLSAQAAVLRHRAALAAHYRPGTALFKKIDSTLRGRPVEELAETIRILRAQGQRALAIVAPAFPQTGRTTVGGAVRVDGKPLEETALWERDHSYPHADLVSLLPATDLRTQLADLDVVNAGTDALERRLRDAIDMECDAILCDATSAAHLETIAAATLPLAAQVFWTGAGGLARALAAAMPPPLALPCETSSLSGGILFVVGSVAEASRAAAAVLAADPFVLALSIPPATLLAGPEAPAWRRAAADADEALAGGRDVLVEIATQPAAAPAQTALLTRRLAALLQPAAGHIGAIFATGGETALALLDALGIGGIQLLAEIEAGVPIGISHGAMTVPIITKAGAFGDAGTLCRCLSHLRRLRPTETRS